MKTDSIRLHAGQVIITGFDGIDPPKTLLKAAARGDIGGFILFGRNLGKVEEVAELNRCLIDSMPPEFPPWLGVDQEGGRVSRLSKPVITLPSMRVFGAIDEPELTGGAADLLGRQLGRLGFNIDFAPVLDVDTNPANPVIGDRSFGREPDVVVLHGLCFILALQAQGIAACGKHFPGHGDTELDSHLALPRLTHERARLDRIELVPFKAVIPHITTIMTAHVIFDAIDPSVPATLSQAVVTGLLREELGFKGVVFSDDLEMKAIADHFGIEEAAVAAVRAGCDGLLICSNPERAFQAHEALVRRAEAESGFAQTLAQAAQRSLQVRRHYRPSALQGTEQMDAALMAENPHIIERRIAQAMTRIDA